MSIEQTRPGFVVSRRWLGLTLALPFLLLLGASLVEWPWRALDLPGQVGSLTPPSILFLILALAGSMFALQQHLPLAMITWVPAGQGALVLLTTGFVANTEDTAVGFAVIIVYGFIYFLVLGLAFAVAGRSGKLAIVFVALFIFTQAARFPVFEADARTDLSAATMLTLLAFLRAAGEIAVLVWLVQRLIGVHEDGGGRTAAAIIGLVLAHGLLAGWEDPLLRDDFNATQIAEQLVRWLMLVGLLLGLAAAMIRLRGSLNREPRWIESAPVKDAPSPPAEPRRLRGRPTPRGRRRR
jgi:hypothetical protein